jgi:hypothetical protein
VPTVFLQHTRMSSGGFGLAREQENPEVREGVCLANQSSPTGFFLESTTSSSSYPSSIIRARPQRIQKAREPSYRAFSDSFARTSSRWQSRLLLPWITVRNTSRAILHPLQFPASFFVIHGISSSSSFSLRRSCSPREFTFHPFSSTTKATPRFALIHRIFLIPAIPFAGISSLSSRSLFSPTRDLIALI